MEEDVKSKKRRQTQVNSQLCLLGTALESLAESIKDLELRLGIILRDPEPTNENTEECDRTSFVPLAENILVFYERVTTLNTWVITLLDRIEI